MNKTPASALPPRDGIRPTALDGPREDLFHQAVDDLDTSQVAFMDGAVGGLSGEGFVMQCTVGVAVEEAADFVFQLAHAHDGLLAEPPRHVLIG